MSHSAQRGFWGGHLENISHQDYGPDYSQAASAQLTIYYSKV